MLTYSYLSVAVLFLYLSMAAVAMMVSTLYLLYDSFTTL